MKKLMAMVMAVMLVMGISVGALAYNVDPTGYGYNNYGYDYNYGYNNYGYGYNYYNYNCTGIRTTFSDEEYNPSAWFETYADEYGVVFHLIPTMPISRSDVFAPVGKAMERAYSRSGRSFSNSYGVNFRDFTWNSSLYAIAGGLYQRGIMIGYPEDNTVRFPQNITRAELAKVLVLTAKQNGIGNAYGTINHQFADMEGHWASQYASECHALGLMVGKSNYAFAPNDYVTYEEYVTVMLRMAERTGYSNYSIDVEDVAYGITTTMDIDFEDYEYSGEFELETYSSSTVRMDVGETKELKVKATIDLEDDNEDIEWEASKSNYVRFSNKDINGKYATVTIKALKEGKITVKAIAEDDTSIYAKFTVIIGDDEDSDEVSSIKVTPSEVELGIGDTKTITAKVYPTSAPDGIIWESQNTAVAKVNQNGKITAVGVGSTIVTATSEEDDDVYATIEVVVTAGGSSSNDSNAPKVELTGADSIDIGKMATLTVKVNENNLSSFEITESDILGLTGGASINKIKKVSNDTYEITLMGVEVSSMALCIDAGVAVDAAGNRSAESNEVIVFINSGE